MDIHAIFSNPGPVEAEILDELGASFVVSRRLLPPVVLRSIEGGQGEPVLFLHDRLHACSIWQPFLVPMAKTNRVIAVDLAGLGQSSSPPFASRDPALAIRFFLDPLLAFIRAFGLERASIVGHSLGGLLALELLLSGVVQPQKLALIAPLGVGKEMSLAARLFYRAKPERLVSVLGKKLFSAGLVASGRPSLPPRLAALEAEMLSELGGKSPPAAAFDALVPLTGPVYERSIDLPRVDVPTLLLWGERDPVLPAPMALVAAAKLPRATLKIFPRLGHAPHLEDTASVLPLLAAFLSS